MSSADYATMYNYALVNAGKSKRFTDEEIQKFRDGSDPYNYPNTDWYDLAFRTGFLQKHNVSVNGGATYAKYLVSAGYLSQKGILRNSDREQFNLRSNTDIKLSDAISLRTNLSYIHNDHLEPIPSYSLDRKSVV